MFKSKNVFEIAGYVLLAGVTVFLIGGILTPSPQDAAERAIERRAALWERGEVPVLSDASLIAGDAVLHGEWRREGRRERHVYHFSGRADGTFGVYFTTNNHGTCDFSRTATFSEGVINLDKAVAHAMGEAYDTLYAVRIDGADYLIPAPHVENFERELAAEDGGWRRFVFKPFGPVKRHETPTGAGP